MLSEVVSEGVTRVAVEVSQRAFTTPLLHKWVAGRRIWLPVLPLPPLLCAQYIGAMYAHIASGKETTPRRVYFEASDPGKPVMRVPKSQDGEGTVVTSYGWDRSEHACTSTEPLRRVLTAYRRHSNVRCMYK